jgi:DNA polymerase V
MELKPSPARLVDVHAFEPGDPLELTLFLSRVAAGFTSPADDHVDQKLDLNAYCVENAAATILGRVEGDSMTGYGIFDGDIVVVNRALEPKDDDIVVAVLDGEMTVKKLRVRGKNGGRRVWLVSGNEAYPPIEVLEGHELLIRGVVTHVIHSCR